MSVKKPLFQVGFDKNAEFDFGISAEVCCAIGTMEGMFRREMERRNPASQATESKGESK